MNDRKTPSDVEAEESALGAMMLSPLACEIGVARLVTTDFWLPAHRPIFDAMVACYEHGVKVDPITLHAALTEAKVPEQIVSRQMLLRIQAATPASANIDYYIEVIIERADRRRLIATADDLRDHAYDMAVDLDTVVASTQAGLENIQRAGGERRHPHFFDWREGVNMHERWIVPGILERRDRLMLVAAEGAGKSFLLRQWALMTAAGVHWFTERKIKPSPVLIIDVENSDRQIVRNTAAMYRVARKMRPDLMDDNFTIIPFVQLDITKRADRLHIESYLAGHRPALVVIGPLYKIMPPPSKDLSYEEAALQGIHVFDSWRARYDCAILMEHHAPKGSGGSRHLDPLGSSAFMRWPEFGLTLTTDRENPRLSLLGHFRGQREQRMWPERLERGSSEEWQWHVPRPEQSRMLLNEEF